MDILLIGSDYFKPWLKAAGARVRHLGRGKESELQADPNRVDLHSLISGMRRKPDLVLLTDDLGSRVLPFGLERVNIPKAYYGVDSPINFYWQKHLAGAFDLILLDQRDQARELAAGLGREVHWLPVGVEPSLYKGPMERTEERKAHDFAFVGTLEGSVRPKRRAIIETLQEHHAVHLAGGRGGGWVGPQEAGRLYRGSRLVLNENLFPGLTTRMLEVMASGGCLFSEDVDNGVRELFKPGVHFIAFNEHNILELAAQYLGDRKARKKIAAKGQGLCLAKHSIQARTQKLLGLVHGLESGTRPADSLSLAWSFLLLGVRWPGTEGRRRIIKAGLMFREHLGRNPGSIPAIRGQALSLLALDRSGPALEFFEGRGRRVEDDFRLCLIKGFILWDQGKKDQAGFMFNHAATLAGQMPGPGSGRANHELSDSLSEYLPGEYRFHLKWGMVLQGRGDGLCPGFDRSGLHPAFWGGAEHLSQAIRLNPEGTEALSALSEILEEQGQDSFALPLRARLAELGPNNGPAKEALLRTAQKGYARVRP